MGAVFLSFLLLVLLPRIFALQSKCYGNNHFSCSHDNEFFSINGTLVDKDLFCKTLKYYHSNCCFINEDEGVHCCESHHSLDGLALPGRKLLQNFVKKASVVHNFTQDTLQSENKNVNKSMLTPRNLAVAASGLLVLCCGLLCPCFQRRQKEMGHHVLSKDQSSMGSVSSVELNPFPEKFPSSPLRVLPSPSRFFVSPKISRIGLVHLNLSQIAKATHNFSSSMKIGEGGFGIVYKAQLPDGQIVAIKRAKKEYFEVLRTEFNSEIELLAKIEHRNLVKLLGYVDKGNERLIITEYVPNGTLREHLDGLQGKVLNFNQRLEISIDVAHGLTYLHLYSEKQIIHRDVKSSNILLTESMRAKVADFGFARLGATDSDGDRTHISTKVRGTIGYLDPEYMRTNQLTPKSDVYSFGILLLEIFTGRRPLELKKPDNERVTVRWAFEKYKGNVMQLVDPLMQEAVDKDVLVKMFGLAFECAAPTRSDRPDMKFVGERLWAIRMDYLRSGRRG